MLESLRREITMRESELSELKAQYDQARGIFGAQQRPSAPAAERAPQRNRRRAKALDWKEVYRSLPPRFTLDTLAQHPSAGKRTKPHLYAIISRWKKERKIAKDASGGYRKVEAGAKAVPRPKRRPRPVAQKAPAAKPETPAA